MAQDAADPIGALLDQSARATPELEEPDTASQPPAPPPPEPTVVLPPGPQPYTPPPRRPQLTAPVFVDEQGKTPDAPPSVRDLAYESRLRSSFASAQGFQGPLEGSWTMTASGADLYVLELRDRGRGVVEGAWRDLRRPGGGLGASGFVDEISRTGSELILRFRPDETQPMVTAVLRSGGDGRWTGEITEQGARRPVSLRRNP